MLFFTSDHHFGHRNIIKYCDRPWDSMEAMDEGLIELWNNTVSPDDTVYHLGDFSLSLSVMARVTPRLNGKKYLVCGNHDQCWPKTVTSGIRKRERYFDAGWENVYTRLAFNTRYATPVLLSHLPYTGHDERYADRRPADSGAILLHGHVHEAWHTRGRQFNVGVDRNGYTPVSEDVIVNFIKRG